MGRIWCRKGKAQICCMEKDLDVISLKLSLPIPHVRPLWTVSISFPFPVGTEMSRGVDTLAFHCVKHQLIAVGATPSLHHAPLPSFPLADTGSILPPICPLVNIAWRLNYAHSHWRICSQWTSPLHQSQELTSNVGNSFIQMCFMLCFAVLVTSCPIMRCLPLYLYPAGFVWWTMNTPRFCHQALSAMTTDWGPLKSWNQSCGFNGSSGRFLLRENSELHDFMINVEQICGLGVKNVIMNICFCFFFLLFFYSRW